MVIVVTCALKRIISAADIY